MKQSQLWLLAMLSILLLVATTSAYAEEEGAHLSGSWELGMSGINTDDNAARVNEYGSVRADDGVSLAPKLDLEFENGGFLLEIESETMGPRDQKHGLGIDAGRVFKLESEYSVLEHNLDHDNLEHIGATVAGDLIGNQPRVSTNNTAHLGADYTTDAEAQAQYDEEMENDYRITRREWKNEAELTIPQLPNVTIKAGVRIEERDGIKQAITTSKCNSCHVEANAKDINERTEDFTVEAVGKFGLLTIEYEYLNRNFNEDADAPYYNYLSSGSTHANVADADALNYSGTSVYNETPDNEKESHMVKARLDLPRNTSISGSYVKADIESSKDGEAGVYSIDDDKLTSEFESFAVKGITRLGDLTLSLRGSTYEIDGPDYMLYLDGRLQETNHTFDYPEHKESAESRDVDELSFDAVYRLAKSTTLRFGYEYEDEDRVEEELGETETHTIKAALKTRFNNQLSGRFTYEYQNIDEPFAGAKVGIAQGLDVLGNYYHYDATSGLAYIDKAVLTDSTIYSSLSSEGQALVDMLNLGNDNGTAVYYWNSVYPSRTLDSTNQPEDVHEAKVSTTWAPAANMSATLYARFRYEENDEVEYESTTYVPGFTFWYAPNSKLNLTMAYNFNREELENRICVGWYHG